MKKKIPYFLLIASIILASCAPPTPAVPPTLPATSTPIPAPTDTPRQAGVPEPVELIVMTIPRELTNEEIAAFEKDNPDIRLKVVEYSQQLFELGIASDDMPDLFRVEAKQLPGLVNEGLVLDITDFMTKSKLITFDDLARAANYFVVNGRYYGLPKDWSLDFSLYVYNKAFEEAGLPLPSTTEPMTYTELAELAGKLTQRNGDTVTRPGFYSFYLERTITAILTQRGTGLFNSDSTEMQLTNNPIALEVVRYFYNMALDGRMPITPENPDIGFSFFDGKLPITQFGYWMGALVTQDKVVYGQVTMLPAPTWDRSLPRLNTSLGPFGLALSATTKHPEEAYRFFEWYVAGQGAEARAKTGWGAPALVSMQAFLPQEMPFDRQRLEVLRSELPYSDWKLTQYPYQSISTAFNQSWAVNMELARAGKIDFDEFASNLQEEVNLAILSEMRAPNKQP
jgi:multiple sugar transport system substrate-binding protein